MTQIKVVTVPKFVQNKLSKTKKIFGEERPFPCSIPAGCHLSTSGDTRRSILQRGTVCGKKAYVKPVGLFKQKNH
jgi:hypothetical protein